jgi:hypothetical protein
MMIITAAIIIGIGVAGYELFTHYKSSTVVKSIVAEVAAIEASPTFAGLSADVKSFVARVKALLP